MAKNGSMGFEAACSMQERCRRWARWERWRWCQIWIWIL